MFTFVCGECGMVKELETDSDIQICDYCSKVMVNETPVNETMLRHTSISLSEVMDRTSTMNVSEDFMVDSLGDLDD